MYLGMDISSKTIHGVVLTAKGEVNRTFKCESTSKDMDIRLKDLGRQFEAISLKGIQHIVIENAVYIQNVKATNSISQVIGTVKYLCSKYCDDVTGVDVKSWKKTVLADGNASKEKIAEFAKARWGKTLPQTEQDFFDAACLALFCLKRMTV